jgi:hypothetical protein
MRTWFVTLEAARSTSCKSPEATCAQILACCEEFSQGGAVDTSYRVPRYMMT